MTVSVVIPIYNEENYIAKCLESLKKQQLKADEVIVVNNNCRDKTVKIAKEYNVTIVNESKQGITYARNKGFNFAKGDIIAKCDADTILPSNWIKKIKRNFLKYPIDALTGPAYFYDLPSTSTLFFTSVLDLIKLILQGNETLNGFNMAITKKFWHKVKPVLCMGDNNVHEDLDLAIHIIEKKGLIRRDKSLIVGTSARRLKYNPLSGLGEYPVRGIKTVWNHADLPSRVKKSLFYEE